MDEQGARAPGTSGPSGERAERRERLAAPLRRLREEEARARLAARDALAASVQASSEWRAERSLLRRSTVGVVRKWQARLAAGCEGLRASSLRLRRGEEELRRTRRMKWSRPALATRLGLAASFFRIHWKGTLALALVGLVVLVLAWHLGGALRDLGGVLVGGAR